MGLDGEPAILAGNENWGTAGAAPVSMRRHRFQDFSLPSQPRDRSRPLGEILREEGVDAGARIGLVGWKTYARPNMSDVPAYIVDEVRRRVGDGGAVENATDILNDAADGLRVINEVEQLAYLEWASCHTSEGVKRLIVRSAGWVDRAGGSRAARLERHAALLPPDAHCGRASDFRPAQSG